jgi:hypothetical protein
MAESVDELTFNYTNEEGQLVRKQLDKEVLSKGAWATVMYLYQDLDRRNNTYRVPKVSIVRYRKSNGVYRKQSSFNISSERQGRHIVDVLEKWYSPDYADSPGNIKKRKAEQKVEKESKPTKPNPPKSEAGEGPAATQPSSGSESSPDAGAAEKPSSEAPPWKSSF